MGRARFVGEIALAALGFIGTVACGDSADHTAVAEKSENPPLAVASGAPVIAYSVASKEECEGLVPECVYVVPKEVLKDRQQLIDLAFELREKFPSAAIEIVDAESAIKLIAAAYRGDTSVPEDFVKKHEVALVSKFIDVGGLRWELISTGDEPAKLSKVIPPDTAKLKALAQQEAARDLLGYRCGVMKTKPVAELSTRDLEKIQDCKSQGEW